MKKESFIFGLIVACILQVGVNGCSSAKSIPESGKPTQELSDLQKVTLLLQQNAEKNPIEIDELGCDAPPVITLEKLFHIPNTFGRYVAVASVNCKDLDCHGCRPYLFVYEVGEAKADGWSMLEEHRTDEAFGGFGVFPDSCQLVMLNGTQALFIHSYFLQHGYANYYFDIVAKVQGKYKLILSITMAVDASGAHDPAEPEYFSWNSKVEVLSSTSNGLSDIRVRKKGTDFDVVKGNAVQVDKTILYRFNGTVYDAKVE